MELKRSSGILMHITSLTSPFGIGDLGPGAYEFIDFLEASGHRYWQVLPLGPTDEKHGHSPYSSFSAFAGNPLLLSPQLLERDELVDLRQLPHTYRLSEKKVNFREVQQFKKNLFEAVFTSFEKKGNKRAFVSFCERHSEWLEDFSLYQALGRKLKTPWHRWPMEFRERTPSALLTAKKELQNEMEKEKILQFLFFRQWGELKNYAQKKGVKFIGDIPFYLNHESADCWAHPENFKLDSEGKPTKISGVPPDLFSEDGQLWGTPVYHWKNLQNHGFKWWLQRLSMNLLLVDVLRLDHFRGFSAYWEVPATERTAKNGKWIKSPGRAFFETVQDTIPEMPFIAEDLGSLDQPVFDLIERFGFPGMKVLQFAFGGPLAENPYIPYNHRPNSVIYTGTHDNDTTRGWYQKLGEPEKNNLQAFLGGKVKPGNIHHLLHRIALGSVGKVAVVPMQDILGLGSAAKMNLPGTTRNNWTWRMDGPLPKEQASDLKELNKLYGRAED